MPPWVPGTGCRNVVMRADLAGLVCAHNPRGAFPGAFSSSLTSSTTPSHHLASSMTAARCSDSCRSAHQ